MWISVLLIQHTKYIFHVHFLLVCAFCGAQRRPNGRSIHIRWPTFIYFIISKFPCWIERQINVLEEIVRSVDWINLHIGDVTQMSPNYVCLPLLFYPSLLVWIYAVSCSSVHSHRLLFIPAEFVLSVLNRWLALGVLESYHMVLNSTRKLMLSYMRARARYVGSSLQNQPLILYQCKINTNVYSYKDSTTHKYTHIKCWSSLFSFSALSILFIRQIFSKGFSFVRYWMGV